MANALSLVSRDIVHDDNISGLEGWDEALLNVCEKGLRIHRALDHHWRGHAVITQCCEQREGLPCRKWHASRDSFALRCAPMKADHVGVDGGFIYEDQTRRVEKALLADPAPPGACDVWPFLLTGMQDLFLRVIPWRSRKRNSAVRLPGSRRLCISTTISSSVLSF